MVVVWVVAGENVTVVGRLVVMVVAVTVVAVMVVVVVVLVRGGYRGCSLGAEEPPLPES